MLVLSLNQAHVPISSPIKSMTNVDKTNAQLTAAAQTRQLIKNISQQQKIEQAKREWDVTVDSLPQLICLVDKNQRILRANRTVEVWNLANGVEVKGQTLPELFAPTQPQTASLLDKFLTEIWPDLDRGESAQVEIEDTSLNQYLHVTVRPIAAEQSTHLDEESSFASVIIEDITHRKRLEAELQTAHDELELRVKKRTEALEKQNNALVAEIKEHQRIEVSQKLLETAVFSSTDGIVISNALQPDNPLIYVNPAFEKITGYTRAEVIGRNTRFLQGKDTKPANIDILRQAVQEGRSCETIVKNYRKDGTAFWNEMAIYPLYDNQNRLTHFVGIQRDVTQRIEAEEALLQSEQRHRWQARELKALYNASQAMASTLDLQTVLNQIMDEVNTLFEAEGASLLLYRPKSDELTIAALATQNSNLLLGQRIPANQGVAGKAFQEKKPILITDAQRSQTFYPNIDLITGLTTMMVLAVPMVHKNKVIGVVEIINPVKGKFINRDIHLLEALARSAAIAIENARLFQVEQKHARRLQQSQTQLIQIEKMAALGRLMASITHEINNPIQSILGFLMLAQETLENQQPVDDDLLLYVKTAAKESQRVADLSKNLRNFYRPSTQRTHSDEAFSLESFYKSIQTESCSLNIHTTLDEVLHLVSKQFTRQNVQIESLWTEELPLIIGHANYLKQVFLNLILNAVDAMVKQSRRLTITTSLHTPEPMSDTGDLVSPLVCITFKDNGIGMSEKTLARIFEPLFTTKESGTGIGLFTSYKIIEAHGGQISATSIEGSGTTFTILLPTAQ